MLCNGPMWDPDTLFVLKPPQGAPGDVGGAVLKRGTKLAEGSGDGERSWKVVSAGRRLEQTFLPPGFGRHPPGP